MEAREVPKGACDVIVTDGFTGNVVLKLTEGLAWNILQVLKQKFTDGIRAKMGSMLLLDKLGGLKKEFDYSEYGGAPILGVKGPYRENARLFQCKCRKKYDFEGYFVCGWKRSRNNPEFST